MNTPLETKNAYDLAVATSAKIASKISELEAAIAGFEQALTDGEPALYSAQVARSLEPGPAAEKEAARLAAEKAATEAKLTDTVKVLAALRARFGQAKADERAAGDALARTVATLGQARARELSDAVREAASTLAKRQREWRDWAKSVTDRVHQLSDGRIADAVNYTDFPATSHVRGHVDDDDNVRAILAKGSIEVGRFLSDTFAPAAPLDLEAMLSASEK